MKFSAWCRAVQWTRNMRARKMLYYSHDYTWIKNIKLKYEYIHISEHDIRVHTTSRMKNIGMEWKKRRNIHKCRRQHIAVDVWRFLSASPRSLCRGFSTHTHRSHQQTVSDHWLAHVLVCVENNVHQMNWTRNDRPTEPTTTKIQREKTMFKIKFSFIKIFLSTQFGFITKHTYYTIPALYVDNGST